MPARFFSKWWIPLLFAVLSIVSAPAQVVRQIDNEKIKLVSLLQQLEEKYQISFSYNHTLLDNFMLTGDVECQDLPSCLNIIQQIAPLKFEPTGDNDFLILPMRKDAEFVVIEEESGNLILPLIIKINDEEGVYLLPTGDKYIISDLFPTDTIQISSRFHQTITISAKELLAMKEKLVLEPETVYLSEVVVEGYLTSGVDTQLSDHSLQIDMKKLGLLAGETDSDILTVLKNIPGIRTPDGKPGSLNFRGSTFDQTLIHFDGIPIYHTGHFFGTISPYNPIAVDKVEIFRGTAPAKWGGRVGGIIDIQTEDPLADSATYALMTNTVYFGGKLKVPLIDNKLGISLAARKDLAGGNLSPKLEAFSDLNFQGSQIDPERVDEANILERFNVDFSDINGKIAYKFNSNHQATVSFVNITNRFDYRFNATNSRTRSTQRVNLDNWGVTGKWTGKISESFQATLGVTRSSFEIANRREDFQMMAPTNRLTSQNNVNDNRLISEVDVTVSPEMELNAGYTLTNHRLEFFEAGNQNTPPRDRDESVQLHSFHASVKNNWNQRLVTTIGIHSDYYERTQEVFFDPRVLLSYMVKDNLFLKASGGRSHQFIKQQFNDDFDDFRINNQFWFLVDKRNPALEGYQGMLGALYEPAGWLVDLEMYRRTTDYIDGQSGPEFERGLITSTGADLFIKKKWNKLETWVSYSLSKVRSEFQDITTTTFYDQPHLLNLTGLLNLDRWSFALTWSYSSGLPVVIPDSENSGLTMEQLDRLIPYTDRFPAQHQLDLSATYKFWNKSRSINVVAGISFLNLYDQENIINVFQEKALIDNPFRQAVGFAPNAHIKFSF